MSETLKPCPFCGGKPHYDRDLTSECRDGIWCYDCDFGIFDQDKQGGVLDVWNRRSGDLVTRAELDAAVAAALQEASEEVSCLTVGYGRKGFEQHDAAIAEAIAAIRAMITAPQADALAKVRAEAVQVKPLEWDSRWSARSSLGDLYELQQLSTNVIQVLKNGTALPGWEARVADAKAAAQADYDARIRRALALPVDDDN